MQMSCKCSLLPPLSQPCPSSNDSLLQWWLTFSSWCVKNQEKCSLPRVACHFQKYQLVIFAAQIMTVIFSVCIEAGAIYVYTPLCITTVPHSLTHCSSLRNHGTGRRHEDERYRGCFLHSAQPLCTQKRQGCGQSEGRPPSKQRAGRLILESASENACDAARVWLHCNWKSGRQFGRVTG